MHCNPSIVIKEQRLFRTKSKSSIINELFIYSNLIKENLPYYGQLISAQLIIENGLELIPKQKRFDINKTLGGNTLTDQSKDLIFFISIGKHPIKGNSITVRIFAEKSVLSFHRRFRCFNQRLRQFLSCFEPKTQRS